MIYDVIVIGAGHAGCEAALAAARLGCRTLVCVMNADTIGAMSCNPAIGGLAKGHLVKEIDALGGEMGKNIDATGIQFRRLNTSKGPAVRSSRAQADRVRYQLRLKHVLESQENLAIRQTTVAEILLYQGRVSGVKTEFGEEIAGRSVVVTTGTFLNGLIHIGLQNFKAGRLGDQASTQLATWFQQTGFQVGRMKTGTVPRLNGHSIDFSRLEPQDSDDPPALFSFSSGARPPLRQRPCYITYTNEQSHDIIRDNVDQSPMFTGVIEGVGARYCPSIEDKVMRFPDKERHQIFLEPEGLETAEFYPNGIPTSLPLSTQVKLVHSITGLEQAEIIRPGYAIEYDYLDPLQLKASLESKEIGGLFLAGQINGTSGYEEAAAQGLMAGVNAVQQVEEKPPLVLDRAQAYIGVLIDDLVTKGTKEPYRLFTSRAEYRLLLREDNADLRLRQIGYDIGLVDEKSWQQFEEKQAGIGQAVEQLEAYRIQPDPGLDEALLALGTSPLKQGISLVELLRRPEVTLADLPKLLAAANKEWVPEPALAQFGDELVLGIKYAGYISRQEEQVARFKRLEQTRLPLGLIYNEVAGLSAEAVEKLSQVRPNSLGQASRISGITPAALSALQIYLKKTGALS